MSMSGNICYCHRTVWSCKLLYVCTLYYNSSSSPSRSQLVLGSLRQTQFSSSQFCHDMDFIFCRSDGSHVQVDKFHPSLLRSPSLSSPRWYAIFMESLFSDVFLVSPLDVSKQHQSCFPATLCDVLYFKSHHAWCHRFSH